MLVLSRKKNESIVIDGGITIHVIEIRGDKVRLGIDAPRSTAVHRQEVADAIAAGGEHPVRKDARRHDGDGDGR